MNSKSLHAGELKEIARLAAVTIADDHACAFACRRAASTRRQTSRKPVIPSARPGLGIDVVEEVVERYRSESVPSGV